MKIKIIKKFRSTFFEGDIVETNEVDNAKNLIKKGLAEEIKKKNRSKKNAS